MVADNPTLVAINALQSDQERPINISLKLHQELNSGSYITLSKQLGINSKTQIYLFSKFQEDHVFQYP